MNGRKSADCVAAAAAPHLQGLGDAFSEKDLLPPLKRGGLHHRAGQQEPLRHGAGLTEVQVHAIGPFQLTYVNPADDPTK